MSSFEFKIGCSIASLIAIILVIIFVKNEKGEKGFQSIVKSKVVMASIFILISIGIFLYYYNAPRMI